jgi:multidrug resistance protein
MNLRHRSVAILFAVLVVVMLGFGIIIPVLPLYARSLGASSFHLGLLMATFSIFQLVFAPIWGSLSDRIGRKPVLLIGLAGYALSHLVNGLAGSIALLFVARVLGGILSSATLPTSLALVADVTGEQDRGSGMGILGAAMGIGVIFGPSLGGFVSHYFDSFRMPFFAAFVLAGILIPFAALFLKETLPDHEQARHAQARRGPLTLGQRLAEPGRALAGPLAFYFVLTFLVSFAAANLEGIFSFWALDRFGYGTREIGIIFTVMGLATVALQGLLVGRAIRWLGENRLVVIGLLLTAVGFFLLTRAGTFVPVVVFVTLNMAGSALVRPGISSAISRRTRAGQGATMGLMSSFDSLGRIVGPVWAGLIYRFGVNLPFFTGAAIAALGLVLALVVFARTGFALAPAEPVTDPDLAEPRAG